MTRWSFAASAPIIAVAVSALGISLALSVFQWRRRGGGWRVGAMEALRLGVVALICFALLKPELVREIRQTEPPQVAILSDASGSMTTRDVPGAPGTVLTRANWLTANATADRWKPLAAKGRVAVETFATPHAGTPDAGTDLNAALERTLSRTANLQAVLLLTDGDWNAGESPIVAAAKSSARNIPIYAVGIGGETALPDLVLHHSTTPAYGLLGDQISIPFKVQSHLARAAQTSLTLSDADGVVARKDLQIPPFGEVADSLVWMPQERGDYALSLKLPIEPEEAVHDNNEQSIRIAIRTETLHVLVIESAPRWEYRYLRNALSRDPGVHVETLLFHPGMPVGSGLGYLAAFPSRKEQLSKFDVVFLGDVGLGAGELQAANVEAIRALVEQQGSGLVFLPGARGRQLTLAESPLGELLPVEYDPAKPRGHGSSGEAHLLLSTAGQGHLLTMLAPDEAANASIWKNLPGFHWSAAVRKPRAGAEVLAVHSNQRNESGRVPLLVTRPFGNGKVLFMGTDGAWRWRRGVEDKYHYRFWGQVVRWMAHQRHLAAGERIRLSFSPENPRTGDTVFLLATVFDPAGFPVERGEVSAQITAPNGSTERVALHAVPGGWGVFKGEFVPHAGGKQSVTIANESGGQKLGAEIFVQQPTREKIGQPANFAILREMAEITGGAVGTVSELDSIVSKIALLPEPKPLEKRTRLWSEWWSGALILTLLAAYWTARKLSGMI